MWIVNFLPDFIFHALLLVSLLALVASFVLDSIPFVSTNAKAIQLASAVVLAIALYFEGAISNNDAWLARVAALERQVAVAEARSKDENIKIINQIVTKREYYRTRGNDVVQYVDREIVKYDNTCPVPREVVKAHNDAAGDKQ